MESFKEMPSNIKLLYALIAILFLLNVFALTKVEKTVSAASSSNKDIESWIKANPEVMLESINKYVMKQQEEMMKQQQQQAGENIKKFEKELKDTRYAGVLNPKGTIEIIEFYDYNCGYCKIASKNVDELLKDRSDVKVILRAIPILGDASKYATEVGVAILISEPAKYNSYYKALMKGSARSKEEVNKAVESVGLKIAKINTVLSKNKGEIESAINANMELAGKIGINGTPAFIVNGELIPGAVDAKTLSNKLGK